MKKNTNTSSVLNRYSKKSIRDFLKGFEDTGAATNKYPIECEIIAMPDKPAGCSWYAFGTILGRLRKHRQTWKREYED